LRGKDFDLAGGVVRVRALKRQEATDKRLNEAAATFVRKLQEEGVIVNRTKKHWPARCEGGERHLDLA
jgi:hypothetical protein